MIFWAYLSNNLGATSIFYGPFPFLIYCVTGNLLIRLWIFAFILEVLPQLFLEISLFAMMSSIPFLVFSDMLSVPLDLRVLWISTPSSPKVIPLNQKSKSQSSKSLSIGLRTSTCISVPVQKLSPTWVGPSSMQDIASLVSSPSLVSSLSPIPSPSLVPFSSLVLSPPSFPYPTPVSSPSLVPSLSSTSSFHHCLHDMHRIHVLQLVAREGIPCNITNVPFDDASTYKLVIGSRHHHVMLTWHM